MESKTNDIRTCDMYEFMSRYVGLSILHPGGRKATGELLESLPIRKGMHILDVGCGEGKTAIDIAKRFDCTVMGIDVDETLIAKAERSADRSSVRGRVSFAVDDARRLHFDDDTFDMAIAQAVLVMIDDQDKPAAVREIQRVLKAGGISGWSELSWGREPTKAFTVEASRETCSKGITNAMTFEGWSSLLGQCGVKKLKVRKVMFHVRGIGGIISDEGLLQGLRIMGKFLSNKTIRSRLRRLNAFFDKYPEYLGYGIYVGVK